MRLIALSLFLFSSLAWGQAAPPNSLWGRTAQPPTPATGKYKLWLDNDDAKLYLLNDAGTSSEYTLSIPGVTSSRELRDTSNVIAFDWAARRIYNPDGVIALDMANANLIGINSNNDGPAHLRMQSTSNAGHVDISAPGGLVSNYQFILPGSDGTAGQVLTATGGGGTEWADATGGDSLPDQTGNSGKFLTTDGSDASWSAITMPVLTHDVHLKGRNHDNDGDINLIRAGYDGSRDTIEIGHTLDNIQIDADDSYMNLYTGGTLTIEGTPVEIYSAVGSDTLIIQGNAGSGIDLLTAAQSGRSVNIKGTAAGPGVTPILKLWNVDDSFSIGLRSPTTLAADYTLTLPVNDGSADQVLTTDGSGVLTWAAPVVTAGSITNSHVNASAAIAYSKLNLSGSILNADVNASAAIARSKLASGSNSHVLINDGSGVMSSEANLAISRGGTGQATAGAAINALLPTQSGNSGKFLTTNATDPSWAAAVTSVSAGSGLTGGPITGAGTLSVTTNARTETLGTVIDGAGSVVPTGVTGYMKMMYDCTITSWAITAKQSGSITFDIWKSSSGVPTVSNTIIAGGGTKPNLSSAQAGSSSTLTSWTTSVSAGDIIGFNVDSATTIQWARLDIGCVK